MPGGIAARVVTLAEYLQARGEYLACAESCTGGWVAKVCTDMPGSSGWFERGFVTYTDLAKQQMLGVLPTTLETYGAVSEATVREMADGALANSAAHWSLAISGIAGPGGGTPDKPVGSVWMAWAGPDGWQKAMHYHFEGDRERVRRQSVAAALQGLLERLETGAR
ncbi:nicotinamide-nucleotide amidase [Thiogranum longum]|uniref:Nicotinamide-nucleotide amidase n=1 Tax=Thiogranum longum TaxID=1537524 RepID=A0A4V2PGQ2_9GAMM|nr:CinA family protein [Thiogranum longum]TCK17676.1 nicotinamide-nucleotide amidase [Thiogranum longum]